MSEDARLNTAAAAAPQADLTGIGVVAGDCGQSGSAGIWGLG